jgi:hypothetical protein
MWKRTEITMETDRIVIIRHSDHIEEIWCPMCGKKVEVIDSETATRLFGDISHKLHALERSNGEAVICLDSVTSILITSGE